MGLKLEPNSSWQFQVASSGLGAMPLPRGDKGARRSQSGLHRAAEDHFLVLQNAIVDQEGVSMFH